MVSTKFIRRIGRWGRYAIRVTNLLLHVLRNTIWCPNWQQCQIVFLDIVEPINLKTLRELLIVFELAGYQVWLRAYWNLRTLRVGDLFQWHRNCQLVWGAPPVGSPIVVCTDRLADEASGSCKYIQLVFDYNPRLDLTDGHFVMPIPMHPQIYVQYQDHERLELHRRSPRKMRILFAGNWNETGYDNPLLGELFGKLTRYQIIEFLRQRKLVRVVSSTEELEALFAGPYWNGFVLVDRHARINQAHWLETIAKADFFLCPPGVLFPWSHNAAEAMAVGTIPLINYPEWFFPELKNRKNAMIFDTLEELEATVNAILQMANSDVSDLRWQVIGYYEQYLNPHRSIDRIIKAPQNHIYLHVLWDEREGLLRRPMWNTRNKVLHPEGNS